MQPSFTNRRDASSAHDPAVSILFPSIFNSESVTDKLIGGPALHTTQELAPAQGSTISAQQLQSLSNERNEATTTSQAAAEAKVSVVTVSANASLTGLGNQPDPIVPLAAPQLPSAAATAAEQRPAPVAGGPLSELPSPALLQSMLLLPRSTASDAVLSPVEVVSTSAWHHALVVFDKMFCVCYVPPKMRGITAVGELVLCEFGCSENVATVVADVSELVADVVAEKEATQQGSAAPLESVFAPQVDRELSSSSPGSSHSSASVAGHPPLYRAPPSCGLATENELCRLPCILRRGTNRDKKRVYFSRLRSSDALIVVHRMLTNEDVVAVATEYQVNFAFASIYLAGDRDLCTLTNMQFQQLGSALLEPLRCDMVEFRFWTEHNHGELDLTRSVLGPQHSETLHDKITEFLRGPTSKPTQAAARPVPQANTARHQQQQHQHQQQACHPQQQPLLQQQQPQYATLSSGGATMMVHPGLNFSPTARWAHPMTTVPTVALLQSAPAAVQQSTMGYAMRPSLFTAPQQQQQQQQQTVMTAPSAPLTLVQSSTLQTMTGVGAPVGAYTATHPTSSFYDPSAPQQQQQQTHPLPPSSVRGAPVYYVMPSPTAVQWDRATSTLPYVEHLQQPHYLQHLPSPPPPPPTMAHMGPAFSHASDSVNAQQQQQRHGSTASYIAGSPMGMQSYSGVSYPMVFSSNGVTYSTFQR